MKRQAELIPKIIDLNNLYAAFVLAAKGKKHKPEVQAYTANLYNNLQILQKQILSGQLDIGHYHYFTIYDPKKRTICAASFPERVLHHAIMRICHPYFEKYQISDSYATRINKGTYKAVQKAKYFSKHYKYYLKLDIRKYFDSISHEILKQQLATQYKDKQLLHIFNQIISSYSTFQKFETFEMFSTTGLPIGNLTSQYFANHYLAGFDHFVKEKLRCKAYVRYMDDMVLWANSSKTIHFYLSEVRGFITHQLNLNLKPEIINTTTHGLNFLSSRLFSSHIELQQKSKKRFLKKHAQYNYYLKSQKWSETDFIRHLLPLHSFTEHASAKGFRRKICDYTQ